MDVNQEIRGDHMSKSEHKLGRKSSVSYSAPTLRIYGSVIDLTAAGSKAGPEGTGTGNIDRKN